MIGYVVKKGKKYFDGGEWGPLNMALVSKSSTEARRWYSVGASNAGKTKVVKVTITEVKNR